MPILLDIAKNGGDVRISLNKFKDEIIGKITSNILKWMKISEENYLFIIYCL